MAPKATLIELGIFFLESTCGGVSSEVNSICSSSTSSSCQCNSGYLEKQSDEFISCTFGGGWSTNSGSSELCSSKL